MEFPPLKTRLGETAFLNASHEGEALFTLSQRQRFNAVSPTPDFSGAL